MKVLVVNCGSTTLKYQLIDSETEKVIAKGNCQRVCQDGRIVFNHPVTGEKIEKDIPMPTHAEAFNAVIQVLLDKEEGYGVVDSFDEIDAIGHRVVHGGELFNSSVVITPEILDQIRSVSDLAPLHNPANILGIEACMKLMPGKPNVAVFDTAFHQTMPEKAYTYGIPYEYYEKHKIRKYGFHGTSHSFVSKRAIELLGKPVEDSKIIVCHIGGGASITAVQNGKSIDTSMGLTPLEGLVMGTRSGSIDPAVIQYIADKEEMSLADVITVLNKKSGLQGLSGESSDMRDIDAGVIAGKDRFVLAYDVFCYSIAKMIGSYVAAMNGVDLIAFTAGIGEWDDMVRKTVISGHLGYLGIELDEEANVKLSGKEARISTEASKVPVYIIPTNEELAIARETVALVK